MSMLFTPPAWTVHALCGSVPDDLDDAFVGNVTEKQAPDLVTRAKELCFVCPVFDKCRQFLAEQTSLELPGVWAGCSEDERVGRKGKIPGGKHGRPRNTVAAA